MADVLWISDQSQFEAVLADGGEVVVDFTAPGWCIPCQRFAPHFDMAAEKSEATFVAVDIDKAPWATVEYDVMSVPTVKLFRDGEFVRDLKERTSLKLLSELQD